jgi:hypothetical protein
MLIFILEVSFFVLSKAKWRQSRILRVVCHLNMTHNGPSELRDVVYEAVQQSN